MLQLFAFLFLRSVYFFSPFLYRFAGHFIYNALYIQEHDSLNSNVANIFSQVVIIKLHGEVRHSQASFLFVLSNHIYTFLLLDFKTQSGRFCPLIIHRKIHPIFSSTCLFSIFTFGFLIHLQFILVNREKSNFIIFHVVICKYYLLESPFPSN